MLRIGLVERQAARLQLFVVAGNAVSRNQFTRRRELLAERRKRKKKNEGYWARHRFCASQGCPSLGSAPCFSSRSAPSLLYKTPPSRSPCPLAASHGVTPALLTALTLTPRSINCARSVFHPR